MLIIWHSFSLFLCITKTRQDCEWEADSQTNTEEHAATEIITLLFETLDKGNRTFEG